MSNQGETSSSMPNDLELLSNVEFKIGFSDTEEKLEKVLHSFLVPIIKKVDTDDAAVKAKVISICSHVSKRIKSSVNVKLPLHALANCFQDSSSGPLVINFVLVYLGYAMVRSSFDDAKSVIPILLNGLSKRTATQKNSIFQMILPVIGNIHENNKEPLNISSLKSLLSDTAKEDVLLLFTKLNHLMLYSVTPSKKVPTAFSRTAQVNQDFVPPGLSKDLVEGLIGKNNDPTWANSLEPLGNLKTSIVKLLMTPLLVPEKEFHEEKFFIFLIGSADTQSQVITVSEEGLKRYVTIDYESNDFNGKLYSLYLRSSADVTPAHPTLKQSILHFLCKSKMACSSPDLWNQVVSDALYGNHGVPKLISAGMHFMHWVCRMADSLILEPHVVPWTEKMVLFIENDPLSSSLSSASINNIQQQSNLRGFAYEMIGILVNKVPLPFQSNFKYLKFLFEALIKEDKSLAVSIQEGLSMMMQAYKKHHQENTDSFDEKEGSGHLVTNTELLSMILHYGNKNKNYLVRTMALKYAIQIFPYSQIEARFLCLMALEESSKIELKQLALEGLMFPEQDGNQPKTNSKLPSFVNFVEYLKKTNVAQVQADTGTLKFEWDGSAFASTIHYLRLLLLKSCNPRDNLENMSDIQELSMSIQDKIQRSKLREYFTAIQKEDLEAFTEYCQWISIVLKKYEMQRDLKLHRVAAFCCLNFVGCMPSSLVKQIWSFPGAYIQSLSSSSIEIRIATANIMAIIASVNPQTYYSSLVQDQLWINIDQSNKKTSGFDLRQGSLLAIVFMISRWIYRHPDSWETILNRDFLVKVKNLVFEDLKASDNTKTYGALVMIAELGRYVPLSKLFDQQTQNEMVDSIHALVKGGKESKIQELGIMVIAQLCLCDISLIKQTFDLFVEIPSILSKNTEINFIVGEAMSIVCGGWSASNVVIYLDLEDVPIIELRTEQASQDAFYIVLDIIVKSSQPDGKPVLKKAACLWLFSLVKYCFNVPSLLLKLHDIHKVFSLMLSDKDDLVQDVAAKGLGLVYELGDEQIRKQLVDSLVSTLSEGKKLQNVQSDTQLFENTAAMTTQDGSSSLTTYQSILSLATEMNQPDLVYKFMHLASNHAIWQSRKGASLGFSKIISKAQEDIRPHLPKILPKFYKFQFDPQPKVAASMKQIWQLLISDPTKMIEEYFHLLVPDVLSSMSDRTWRLREASCLALADLVQGKEVSLMKSHFEAMWTECFRALDDIKESVRIAAFNTCKALTNVTLKYCNPETVSIKEGQDIMGIIMPFFLVKGLNAAVEDIQKYALHIILKVCQTSGVLLKRHVNDIIITLLEALTTMEPQVMNYLSFHVEKYNVSTEQFDSSRVYAARMSPMMEAIEQCVEQLDLETMDRLVTRLSQTITKAVGLPTKAGSARFVVNLTLKNKLNSQHADKLLNSITLGLRDRSSIVRQSFSVSMGYLSSLNSNDALEKLLNTLKTLYLQENNEDQRESSSFAYKELASRATEKMKPFHEFMIPLMIMGMQDPKENVRNNWTKAWEEVSGGASSSLLQRFGPSVLSFMEKTLEESNAWRVKQQISASLYWMVSRCPALIPSDSKRIIKLMLSLLSGRTWEGKEVILSDFSKCCIFCKDSLIDPVNKSLLDEVMSAFIREAKKNKKYYKRFAIEALGNVMDGLEVFDYYFDLKTELQSVIESIEQAENSLMVVDDKDDGNDLDEGKTRAMHHVIKASIFKSLGKCFPKIKSTDKSNNEINSQMMGWLNEITDYYIAHFEKGQVWNVRKSMLEGLLSIAKKVSASQETDPSSMALDGQNIHSSIWSAEQFTKMCQLISLALDDQKYQAVRVSAVTLFTELSTEHILGLSQATLEPIVESIQNKLQSEALLNHQFKEACSKLQTA